MAGNPAQPAFGQLGAGQHRPDPRRGTRSVCVDPANPAMGNVRPHDMGEERARPGEVIDEGSPPGDKPYVLAPFHRLPYPELHGPSSRSARPM